MGPPIESQGLDGDIPLLLVVQTQSRIKSLADALSSLEKELIRIDQVVKSFKDDLIQVRNYVHEMRADIGELMGRQKEREKGNGHQGSVNVSFGDETSVGRDVNLADRGGKVRGGNQGQSEGGPGRKPRRSKRKDQDRG